MFSITSYFSLDYPDTTAIFSPFIDPFFPFHHYNSLLIQIPFFSLRVSQLSLLQRSSFWSQFPLLPTWDFLIFSRMLIPLCLHFHWNSCSVSAFSPLLSYKHLLAHFQEPPPVSDWHSAHWGEQCLRCLFTR